MIVSLSRGFPMSVSSSARRLIVRNRNRLKNRQQSLLSRSASQVGIDVSGYWGHIQGKVQPTFRVDYDRSHATMS